MRSLSSFLVLLALTMPAFGATSVPSSCQPMVMQIGVPEVKNGNDGTLLCREGYLLSHNNVHHTPDWVVELLTPQRFIGPGDRDAQNNPFAPDPDLAKLGDIVIGRNDYKRLPSEPSLDKGHMAPAADMKFSINATTESFYMSNMAPQQGNGLNRHIWADLEALVRDWTCDRSLVHAITGPIYDEEPVATLGSKQVAIPTAFYKAMFDPSAKRFIAFILPNRSVDKHGKTSWEALKDYQVTLTELEDRTGINFLTGVGKRDRTRLASLKSEMWVVKQGCPRTSKNK